MGWFILGILIGIAIGYLIGHGHESSELEVLDSQSRQGDEKRVRIESSGGVPFM